MAYGMAPEKSTMMRISIKLLGRLKKMRKYDKKNMRVESVSDVVERLVKK